MWPLGFMLTLAVVQGASKENLSFNFFIEDQFERQLRLFLNTNESACDNLFRMVCPSSMQPHDSLIQHAILSLSEIVLAAARSPPNPILWEADLKSWKNNSFEDHFDFARQTERECKTAADYSKCLDDEFVEAKLCAKWAMTAKVSFWRFNSTEEKLAYSKHLLVIESIQYINNDDYKVAMIGLFTKQVTEVPVQVMTQFIRLLTIQVILHRYTLLSASSTKSSVSHRVKLTKRILDEYKHYVSEDKVLTPEHRKVAIDRLNKVVVRMSLDHSNETVARLQNLLTEYTSSYYRVLPSDNVTLFDVKRSHAYALSRVLRDDTPSLVLLNDLIGVLAFMANAITHQDISIGAVVVLASSYNVPPASMYGMLGSVVGHELTHIVSDKNDTEFQPELKIRLDCLINHYSDKCDLFPEIGACYENKTYVEDMADFEGLHLSYKLFKKEYGDKFKIKPYKNIPFNYEQLFFISWAQLWCQTAAFENDMVHSPNFARVNIALSQQPSFRKAFGCQPKDRMGIEEMHSVMQQMLFFIVLPCIALASSLGPTEDEIMDNLHTDISEHKVMLYSKTYCRWSRKIKSLLHEYDIKDIKVVEVNLEPHTRDIQRCLYHISGSRTVPQLFINGSFIGGFTDTKALEDNGDFKTILEKAGAI